MLFGVESVVHDFLYFGFLGFEAAVVVIGRTYYEALVFAQTGTGGDEVTADNVLLHTLEAVGLALDSGFVEHLGGFLERSGRHEARCLQGGTCDTLKDLLGGRGA